MNMKSQISMRLAELLTVVMVMIVGSLTAGCRHNQPGAATEPGVATTAGNPGSNGTFSHSPTSSTSRVVSSDRTVASVPAASLSGSHFERNAWATFSAIPFRGIGSGNFNGFRESLITTSPEAVIVGISSQSQLLLTGWMHDDQFRILAYDLAARKIVLERDEPAGIEAVEFARNGRSFAYNAAELGDTKTWQDIGPDDRHEHQAETGLAGALAFSPDGRWVVLPGGQEGVPIQELSSGMTDQLLKGHQHPVQVAAFSPDSQTLVTGDAAGHLIRWELATGEKLGAWSFTSSLLSPPVTEEAGKSGKPASTKRRLTAIAISPDQHVLAIGTSNGYTQTFDMEHGGVLSPVFHQAPVTDVVFASDAASMLVVTQVGNGRSRSVTRWWRAPDPPARLTQQQGSVRFAALDAIGRRAVTGGVDRHLSIWDVETKSLVNVLDNGEEAIAVGALSPNGRRAVTAAYGSGLVLWDLDGMTSLGKRYGHQKRIWTIDFAVDNDTFASGSDDQTVRIWSFSTQKTKQTIALDAAVRFVRFSPDGQFLVTATLDPRGWQFPARLQIWDAVSAKPVAEFQGHRAAVNSAVFSLNGQELISCDADGYAKRWEVSTGKMLSGRRFPPGLSHACLMERRGLTIMRRYPNGILINRTGDSGPVAAFSVPTRSISALNVSRQGNRIVAGSDEGAVYVWDFGHESSLPSAGLYDD